MEDLSSNLEKIKSTFNPWDDAQILSHIRTHDFTRLKNLHAVDAMPARIRKRDAVDIASENYYNTVDRAPFNYAKVNNTVNTMHLQNPYRPTQRLEGYASHDYSKDTYQDSSLRWRHNNFVKRKESVTNKNSDKEESEKVERSKKKHQGCSQVIKLANEYCTNSTLHGLRYVGDSNLSVVERVFWMISFTIALVTAIYYIIYLYDKWNRAPIIISLSPEPVAFDEFPFPSVTICNMNHAKKTEARRIHSGSDVAKKLMLDDMCDANINTTDKQTESIDWETMLQFMINVTQPCTEMLYFCKWHGVPTDCKDIFNPTMTDEGICCNFNGVNRQFLFHDARDWPSLNITYPSPSVDWNAEKGYNSTESYNGSVDVIPWRPYGAGKYYGLSLALDVNVDEYFCTNTASAGFKMLLHNPVETPKIADFSFSIMPGEETRVIVKPKISTASKTLISIPKTKRKCFFTAERKLRYYRTYTQRNCVLECEANFTRKMCSCVQYYMPKSSNTPICGKKDELCAINARRAMEMKLYDEDTANSLNVTETPSCNCWPGCFEINYKAELSHSRLMSIVGNDQPYMKNNGNYFTKNMAMIHIFFVDSQFTKHVKTELFGFTEFLSSTGGLLGLFLGFSFLSCMEILYFATLRLWCRWYRQRESSKLTALQAHPLDQRKKIYPFAN